MLFFLKAKDGKNYYLDEENNFWRAYIYVDNAFTYDYPENNDILRLVGDGFGLFQNRLSDFDASILYETIPNFHNTKVRIETFKNSVKKDSCKRVSRAEKEISYILSAEKEASVLSELVDNEAVPLRVTHNDTKCNNLLFDKNLKIPVAVIDLDTIMPGLSAYDFGDAVRVVASTAMEDEPDISKVHIDLERFESFTSGFVSRVSSHLEPKEIDLFALGAFTMTYEVGLRFLTDYLDGDVYFKIGYPEHNLIRARVQLALADDIRKNLEEMKNIVKKYC